MSWLMRFFGHTKDAPVPTHIQQAIDTSAAANEATDEAKSAVSEYWKARATTEKNRAVINDYSRADSRVARRRK